MLSKAALLPAGGFKFYYTGGDMIKKYVRNYPESGSFTITEKVDEYWGGILDSVENCSSLVIPEGVTTIPSYAFFFCNSLKSISLPSSIVEIHPFAFKGCINLSSIEIPNRVKRVSKGAFEGCRSLTFVEIPNSVTSIGYRAFADCSKLKSISIPSSVTEIVSQDDHGAHQYPMYFCGCNELEEIVVSDNNPSFSSKGNCLLSKDGSVLYQGCITSVIPESVTRIERYAFWGVTLKSIVFPKRVTNIEKILIDAESISVSPDNPRYNSENNCILNNDRTHLIKGSKSSVIPDSVIAIDEEAFLLCRSLISICIPPSIQVIKARAFKGCDNLNNIELPNTITELPGELFNGCSALSEVEIPNSIHTINTWAFRNCLSLSRIIIPSQVSTISESAFHGCSNVKTIIVSRDNPYYSSSDNCLLNKDGTIMYMGCQSSVIPFGVKQIIRWSHGKKTTPNSINIPNSVTHIGDGAFYGAIDLRHIEIPNSVTHIGKEAFRYCLGLRNINIPNSVIEIGDGAFRNCTGLTAVSLGKNMTKIGAWAFCECPQLKEVTIPNKVSIISSYCFSNCISLETVIITDGIIEIEDGAFESCKCLSTFIVPAQLIRIGRDAFFQTAIRSIDIPSTVSYIGEQGIGQVSHIRLFFENPHEAEKCLEPVISAERAHQVSLSVPIGTGYAYRHHHFFLNFKSIDPIL